MGLLSNSVTAHPYQNQTWVPPRQVSDKRPILHSSIVIFSKTLEVSKEHKYHILGNITLFTNYTGTFLFQYLGLHITYTFTYMPTTSKYKIQKLACNWLNIGSFCLIASHLRARSQILVYCLTGMALGAGRSAAQGTGFCRQNRGIKCIPCVGTHLWITMAAKSTLSYC